MKQRLTASVHMALPAAWTVVLLSASFELHIAMGAMGKIKGRAAHVAVIYGDLCAIFNGEGANEITHRKFILQIDFKRL